MALTPAERKRLQREREKQEREASAERTRSYLSRPFFQFLVDHPDSMNVDMALDAAGLAPPEWTDDRGPSSHTGQIEAASPDSYAGHPGSIGRAEIMIGALLDAATELARIVNAFKTQEVEHAMARLEASDLSDPARRRQTIAELLELSRTKEQLAKSVRWTLPQWMAKGG